MISFSALPDDYDLQYFAWNRVWTCFVPDLTIVGGEVDLRSETWITLSKHDLIEKDIILENYALCSFSVAEAEKHLSFPPFLTLVHRFTQFPLK